jgi:hypothetical protein
LIPHLLGLLLLIPTLAAGQTGIQGLVTDSSGGAMPGVTVEAASPALIEKVRVAVTGDNGQYRILGLVPGVYTVTFSLGGFTPVKREGIQLVQDFTAPINVTLQVGGVAEQITVEATAPIVDVTRLSDPKTVNSTMMSVLPLGNRTTTEILQATVPGVQAGALGTMTYRGSTDTLLTVDGNRTTFLNAFAGAGATTLTLAAEAYQEYSVTTAIDAVDSGNSGMRVNVVPKDGGNQFSGTLFTIYQGLKWTSNNIPEEYRVPPYNLTQGTGNRYQFDINPSFGGPIKRDGLWYQATLRYGNTKVNNLGIYEDSNPDPRIYQSDVSKAVFNNNEFFNGGIRITWQASPKDKVAGYYDNQRRDQPFFGLGGFSPDPSSTMHYGEDYARNTGIKWTRTQTSRLLFEAQASAFGQHLAQRYRGAALPWSPREDAATTSYLDLPVATAAISSYSINNVVTNMGIAGDQGHARTRTARGDMTYYTSAHTFRVGGTFFHGNDVSQFRRVGDIQYLYSAATVGGVTTYTPNQISANLPTNIVTRVVDIGLWFQDQWTHNRLTTKLGVRYDGLRSGYPDQFQPASPWLAELRFPGASFLRWHDITPRASIAYDVFGDGKTALKGGVARFVTGENIGTTRAANPMSRIVRTATAAWTDLNGDFTVYNADRSVQSNEINTGTEFQGRFQDSTFGSPLITTDYDPDYINGWYKRGYEWETDISISQQILPRLSGTFTWYHRTAGNQIATDNLNITSSSAYYTGPFCLRAPTNTGLPDGGAFDVCGLYDQTALGATEAARATTSDGRYANFVTHRTNLGTGEGMTDVTNGFDLNLNGRLTNGAFIQGGFDLRTRLTDTCDVIDNPEVRYCRTRNPWTLLPRFTGAYTLQDYESLGFARAIVRGIQVSGTYRMDRGATEAALWTACDRITAVCTVNDFANSAALGLPTLGRPLRAVTGQKQIQLIEPNTLYYSYVHVFNARFAKQVNIQRNPLTLGVDLYNLFNAGDTQTFQTAYGFTGTPEVDRTWSRPLSIIPGRSYRVNATLAF